MEFIFGYRAHLVLEDDDGNEFEVARPFRHHDGGATLLLDLTRILDAIHERQGDRLPARRPAY